jgi:hypothetical protein
MESSSISTPYSSRMIARIRCRSCVICAVAVMSVGVELGVDQVQGQRHHLDVGQQHPPVGGDQGHHVPGHRNLGRVEVLHFPAQGILDLGGALRGPSQGEAQVVRQRQQHVVADVRAQPVTGQRHHALGQFDIGRGDLVDQGGDPFRTRGSGGHETALDPAGVDGRPRRHLEPKPTPEQHVLDVAVVDGQHDVVVETFSTRTVRFSSLRA